MGGGGKSCGPLFPTPRFLWLKLGQVLRSLQQLSMENESFPKGLGTWAGFPLTSPPWRWTEGHWPGRGKRGKLGNRRVWRSLRPWLHGPALTALCVLECPEQRVGPCGAKEPIPTLETAGLFRISVPRAQTGRAFCMHRHSPHSLSGRGWAGVGGAVAGEPERRGCSTYGAWVLGSGVFRSLGLSMLDPSQETLWQGTGVTRA